MVFGAYGLGGLGCAGGYGAGLLGHSGLGLGYSGLGLGLAGGYPYATSCGLGYGLGW